MPRPKRRYEEEVSSAEERFTKMREFDADLLGLADDIDAIFYGESRVPPTLDVPSVEPGPVKVYRITNPCCGSGCDTPFEGECAGCTPDGTLEFVCERPMTTEERDAWEKSERGDG